MKTKYFLTALALPAVFAACSSEEFEIANQDAALNSRIELQDVTFVTGGIDSRLVQGDNNGDGVTEFNELLFQANDGMGACLIDVKNDLTQTDPIKRYNLVTDYIQSNYRYSYANGVWNSQANLVEGNYMFYMPYNASAQGRSAIVANLPSEQTLALDANGEYSTFADVVAKSVENGYPLVAGYKFLKAGDSNTQLDLTLQPIYAYPKFTLSNITGEDIVISSIEITPGSGEFQLVKPFKFAAAAGTAYAEADQDEDSFVDCFFDAATSDNGKNGDWSLAKMNNTVAKSTANILGSVVTGGSNVITIAVDNYELAADEEFSFYAVIPAGTYNDLTVKITSAEGTSAKFVYPACHLNPGKRYPVAEYTEAGTVATKGEILTGIIAGLEVDNSVAVSDNNALLRAIAGFNPNGTVSSIDIRMTNQNVAITSALVGVLKNKTWTNAGTINFVSDVTIDNAGDWMTSLPANMTINFKKNVTVKGANNTIAVAQSAADVNFIATAPKLTIASGATAAVKGTCATMEVENNGIMNINAALSVDKVANKGTMNLAANLTTTNGTTNTKDIVVKASATVNGALTNGNASQVAASLTVNKVDGSDQNVVFTAANLENKKGASITNYGTITSTNLANAGTITNGASNNVNAEITATSGSNTNTIDNYAELTINENTGTINMKSFMGKAAVSTAHATLWGNIENTVGATVTASDTQKQYIWKTITGGNNVTWPTAVANSFNSVKFVGANVVTSTTANTLVQVSFDGGSLTNSGSTTLMPAIFNVSGETTITGTGSIGFAASAEINVLEDAVLNIVGQSLTIGASTLNIGKNATVNSNAVVTAVTEGTKGENAVWNKSN